MARHLFRKKDHGPGPRERRLPLFCWILMFVGLLTLLYLFITYVLMPVLAMLTVS